MASATLQSILLGSAFLSRAAKNAGRFATTAGIPPYITGSSGSVTMSLNTLKATSWFLLSFMIAKVSPCSFAVILPLISGTTAISQLVFDRSKQQVYQVCTQDMATLPVAKRLPL